MTQPPTQQPPPPEPSEALTDVLVRWWSAIVGWLRISLLPSVRGAFEAVGRLIVTSIYRVRRTNLRIPVVSRDPASGGGLIAKPDDDAASIIGRIDTADDVQLVLMVPRNARELRDPNAWSHIAAHVRRHCFADVPGGCRGWDAGAACAAAKETLEAHCAWGAAFARGVHAVHFKGKMKPWPSMQRRNVACMLLRLPGSSFCWRCCSSLRCWRRHT